MASKWDGIQSKKILAALRDALKDDRALSHAEAVDVLRSTLEDGFLTKEEIGDLMRVVKNSDTMQPRSLWMFTYLIGQAISLGGATGTFNLSGIRKEAAANRICDFMKRKGSPFFPKLDRDIVGIDLLMRVANPGIIHQRAAGFCGIVSFLFSLATDAPANYAQFAIDLFEKGRATFRNLEIKPSSDCRNYSPGQKMNQADWLTAASIRDSENLIFDVEEVSDGFNSGTTTADVIKWLGRAGYTDIRYEDNMWWSRPGSDIGFLNNLFNKGYRIVLSINHKMLKAKQQKDTSGFATHLVVLTSEIKTIGNNVSLEVFTWGQGKYMVPQGDPLSKSDFLGNLYGYVAGRPF